MLSGLRWLALEVKYLAPAVEFYRDHLDLPVERETDTEVALAAGDSALVLRAPSGVPRGGLHTHYAFSTAADAYDGWWDRLSTEFDLHEETFGSMRSLYFYDTEGNCVEIGGRDESGEGITGIFEVVLEVEDLDRALAFYEALGMETVDVGERRKRVRLTAGAFDLELWEPHLGLADARGGVHVDLGLSTSDLPAAREAVGDGALAVVDHGDGIRARDPDGHYLTLLPE
jgi:catechol-2,3-dioxygenase